MAQLRHCQRLTLRSRLLRHPMVRPHSRRASNLMERSQARKQVRLQAVSHLMGLLHFLRPLKELHRSRALCLLAAQLHPRASRLVEQRQ